MTQPCRTLLASCFAMFLAAAAGATEGSEIINFRSYSPVFASSGQPSAEQLQALKQDGYEVVIYLAFSDQERSLADEDRIVKDLGMRYVHIPVDWAAPQAFDYASFAAVMDLSKDTKTLLHCVVNYRASAFSFLHRVIDRGIPIAEAKADMNSVWTPDQTWTTFIRDTLAANGVDPDCDGCDWTPASLGD